MNPETIKLIKFRIVSKKNDFNSLPYRGENAFKDGQRLRIKSEIKFLERIMHMEDGHKEQVING